MKIHFYLHYFTTYGQTLALSGNHPALGNDDPAQALVMEHVQGELWHTVIELDHATAPDTLTYRYHFRDTDGAFKTEWGHDRRLPLATSSVDTLHVTDAWHPSGAVENTFLTQAFNPVQAFADKSAAAQPGISLGSGTVLFRVKAPLLGPDEVPCLSGHGPALGSWEVEHPLMLQREPGSHWWSVVVDLSAEEEFPLPYKYGIWSNRLRELVRYEQGANRVLNTLASAGGAPGAAVQHDGFLRVNYDKWRGAGVAIPVFSLRSEQSLGVGEFTDLPLLADWAKLVGIKLIQLLPINDTSARHTWEDSYPYAAISAFALHPIYVNLTAVAGDKHPNTLSRLLEDQAKLNALDTVDYEAVMEIKREAMWMFYCLQMEEFANDPDWHEYFAANQHWLKPYAAFCYLRDQNGTADFNIWESHRAYNPKEIEKLTSPRTSHYNQIAVHYFTQWHLHRQLRAAADYLHQQGIVLKGDIPIGIYRHSCDAWMAPGLYNMDQQAGAPPDDFAEKGQNWGFPTYNWARMKQDGFAWWRQRFAQMSLYFDAFRIDHILGFFRIWSIPIDAVEGLMGRFVPALPVSEQEFHDAGIGFDFDRLCRPYITDAALHEIFGEDAQAVVKQFLSPTSHSSGALRHSSQYEIKPAYATQRQVEAFFQGQPPSERNDRIRDGLYSLISNVILFPEKAVEKQKEFASTESARKSPSSKKAKTAVDTPPVNQSTDQPIDQSTHYHFRFGIEKISSFRHLEGWAQEKIRALYNDYFYRRQDEFWRQEAMEKLPALKRSTNMLICGEDLGMVPHSVPGVMKELAILTLEIQRMPKAIGATFFHPKDAPYLSVVTPSTHDMSTIRGWWEEDRALTQRFFNEVMGYPGDAPYFCEPWANWAILRQHLQSPAMWSIFQLQDLLGMSDELRRENPHDERINIPADPRHYWRYRMHLTLENLRGQDMFNGSLRRMINEAGRVGN